MTHTGTTRSPVSNVAAVGVLTHAAAHYYAHMFDIHDICMLIRTMHDTHTGTTCSPVSNVAAVGVLAHAATHYYAHMYDIYDICMHIRTMHDTHRYNTQSGIQRGCCKRPHSCSHTLLRTYV